MMCVLFWYCRFVRYMCSVSMCGVFVVFGISVVCGIFWCVVLYSVMCGLCYV